MRTTQNCSQQTRLMTIWPQGMNVNFNITLVKANAIIPGYPSSVKPKSRPSPFLTSSPNQSPPTLVAPNLPQTKPPIIGIDYQVSIPLLAALPKLYSTTLKLQGMPARNFKMPKRPQHSTGTLKDQEDASDMITSPQSTGSLNIRKNDRDSAYSTATQAASQATSDSLPTRVRYGGC